MVMQARESPGRRDDPLGVLDNDCRIWILLGNRKLLFGSSLNDERTFQIDHVSKPSLYSCGLENSMTGTRRNFFEP